MDTFEVPIFRRAYDLYRDFYVCLKQFPKSDRHAIGQKTDLALLEVLELLLEAGSAAKAEKAKLLDRANTKLNLFRMYLRLGKEVRAIDAKRYVSFQEATDEVGRMLGGWRRSLRES